MENKEFIPEKFKGKMYTINSGNLGKIGWEWNREDSVGVLRVEFVKGSVYYYWPVSKWHYQEIFQAESKGKWFQENIVKNKALNYERVL